MKRLAGIIGIAGLVLLGGCSPYKTVIKQAEGLKFPGMYRFRINYVVHDDAGKEITDEIMNDETELWFLFCEMCDRAKVALEEKGYQWVFDPKEPADFTVDVGFSGFYSSKATEEEMWNQKPATILVGLKKEEAFTHMIILSVLAYDPKLGSEEMVVLWEGRGTMTDSYEDPRIAGFPIMVELMKKFQNAVPR